MSLNASSLGEAVLDLRGDKGPLEEDINAARGMTLSALEGLAMAGGAIITGLIAGLAAVVSSVGVAIWTMGNEVDAALDTIAVRTGAQGDILQQLEDDFRAVYASVPTDAQSAADVIGVLNSRLDIQGTVLQGLSAQVLEYSRMTGTDAVATAELFSRAIGDWGVPVEEAAGSLDQLFVVSQMTGASMESLLTRIVQYGAPMRQFGYSFEEAAVLLGRWEAEGVNVELVLGSLRIAAGNFAEANIPLRQGLEDTFEAIKNAASESEALNIAMEIFGSRAGPDMAAAIREGRFDLDEMVAALGDTEGAILSTAEATMDWGERWQMFKNQLTNVLAPIGMQLMDVASQVIDALTAIFNRPEVQTFIEDIGNWVGNLLGNLASAVPEIIDWFIRMFGWLGEHRGVIVAALAAIGVAIGAFVYTVVIPAAISAITALAPVIAIILAVAAVAYLLYEAWTNNWGGIRDFLTNLWTKIQPIFQAVVEWFQTNIPVALRALKEWWDTTIVPMWEAFVAFLQTYIFPALQTLVEVYFAQLQLAIAVLAEFWNTRLLPAIQTIWLWLSTYLFPILQAIGNFIGAVFNVVFTALVGLWQNVLLPALQAVWSFLQDSVFPLFQAIGNFIGAVFNVVFQVLAGIWQNFLLPAIQRLWTLLQENVFPIFQQIGDYLQRVFGPVVERVGGFFRSVWIPVLERIQDVIADVIRWLQDMADTLNNLELPDWLTPGSPTPFELGVVGISRALDRLNNKGLPGLTARLDVPDTLYRLVGSGSGAAMAADLAGNSYTFVNHIANGQVDENELMRIQRRQEMLYAG